MRVMQINATVLSSTGGICRGLAEEMNAHGIKNRIVYSQGELEENELDLLRLGDLSYLKRQAVRSHIFGNFGFNSKKLTKKLMEAIEDYQPDIVHLHNIHTHNCHMTMLFEYFKQRRQRLVWTFHDCWPFTAYCPHFTICGCEQWKTGCRKCPQYKDYSLFFDRSRELYQKKKDLAEGLDLTIVTPSDWLAEIVRQSFFGSYPIITVHNGIDTSVFRPTESSFREDHGISPKQKMILGVAFGWGYKKGLDVFCRLAELLDGDRYRIVLVGVDDSVKGTLPPHITAIARTADQKELAAIYTAADIFVNPTREEVLGLVNIEANACGTPVVTFDAGGSPECIDETSGAVVPCDDTDALVKRIEELCSVNPKAEEDCIRRAALFDQHKTYRDYISIYEG